MKDYLQRIGRVRLPSAEQEVALAIRMEVGVLAEEKLNSGAPLDPQLSRDLAGLAEDGQRARTNMLEANLRLVVSWPSGTLATGCRSWTCPGGQPGPE